MIRTSHLQEIGLLLPPYRGERFYCANLWQGEAHGRALLAYVDEVF